MRQIAALLFIGTLIPSVALADPQQEPEMREVRKAYLFSSPAVAPAFNLRRAVRQEAERVALVPPVQRSSPSGSTSSGWKCRTGWIAIGAVAGALFGLRAAEKEEKEGGFLQWGHRVLVPVGAGFGALTSWVIADRLLC